MKQQIRHNKQNGFSLTEMIMAAGMMSLLSAIAIPNYHGQLIRTRQNECTATMSQILTATMGYYDEKSRYPTGWSDLNEISAIMLESGTAKNNNHFDPINLSNENYSISASQSGDIFTFECLPRQQSLSGYNVLGCLSVDNGASEIKRGRKNEPVETVTCN